MTHIGERNAEMLIQEHLRERGWDLTDFDTLDKDYTLPSGLKPDYVIKFGGKPVAIIEAKKPGKDLQAALKQARDYANEIGVTLIFASDGEVFLRQNLAARVLPEKIDKFPTPIELREFFNPVTKNFYGSLRDYQKIAVSQVVGAVLAGRRKMFIQAATGTGKTMTAAGIIAKLASIGKVRRTLFLVDRDSLADQAAGISGGGGLRKPLGDYYKIRRADGDLREDLAADVLVTTVQFLATRDKFKLYPANAFDLVILDECHRSYFGDWHKVLEHFFAGGAVLLGLTATPSDKETVNTDAYFGPPIFRYTYRQGVKDGILADCRHFKFLTNVDISGVHDMGFDFEPEQLGRAVDVPKRNELIAQKYFEIVGPEPVKTLVFAASIQHAINLQYAFIKEYNRLHDLPPNDSKALDEEIIVAIHNQMPKAKELIKEFQKVGSHIKIAISVDMMSTGIDAPDIEVLVMARPTKSKVLYVQMKGRGTRKCEETGKEYFKLIDFVDLGRIEEVITNDSKGIDDVEDDLVNVEPEGLRPAGPKEDKDGKGEIKEPERREMVIADVPVWIEYAEVIAPETLDSIKKQLEAQLTPIQLRRIRQERFKQAVLAWRYFKGQEMPDPAYLEAMGFDLHTLRDIFGEADASLEEFIDVVEGKGDFLTSEERKARRRKAFEKWALETKGLNQNQVTLLLMLFDFKQANPNLTPVQLLRSQWLQYQGGLRRIEELFGSIDSLLTLYEEGKSALQ